MGDGASNCLSTNTNIVIGNYRSKCEVEICQFDHDLECFDNFNSVERKGFNVLHLQDCNTSYIRDKMLDNLDVDHDSNCGIGKRNRQDSCNSNSNEAVRKINKKSRKKLAKKLALDAEIEKIMNDIEVDKKSQTQKLQTKTCKETSNSFPIKERKAVNDTVPCEKILKKKKKKVQQNLIMKNNEDSSSIDSENCTMQIKEIKNNGLSKFSSNVRDDICYKSDKNKTVDGKKDRKRPGKKQLALIQAAIKKAEEEQERQIEEELAKQKRAEEMERLKLDKLKQEEERKLKKKIKEKEKRVRLKAEGKILTKAQKLAKIRVEASKNYWKEQQLNIPKVEKNSDSIPSEENVKSCNNQLNNYDENIQHSPTISVCSQESSEMRRISESESVSTELILNVGSRHLSELKSSIESTTLDIVHLYNSNDINLNCHCQSDLSINNTTTDTKSLHISQSLHSLSHYKNKEKCVNHQEKIYSNKFRSPIVCVLGHVDTGKTKILDKIRKTHVQTGEAGGITQQIGATMVPRDSLKEKCSMVKLFSNFNLELPGLLIIDTPGHESFRNLRFRGTSLCDVAILVVDIMHGLEPQTIESINLLKEKNTPFIVALNKIDRLYNWHSFCQEDIENAMKQQSLSVQMEFEKRFKEIVLQFANQSLNVALYYENPDPFEYISVIPVSAISGDGMGNLLAYVCQLSQNMSKKLTFSENLQASVLEVKTAPGLGTTIDVILVNGRLKEGDTIILAGQDGPIVSQIRSLLMPQPLKELRIKTPYIEYKEVKGAQGVKISGRDLDKAVAGLPLYVAATHDQILPLKDKVLTSFPSAMNSIRLSERGVYVQASTLGSLEALLEYLKASEIPYSGVKVGPVVKKDVIKASVMLEHDFLYAVILAFDVKIEKDAQELADCMGIKIFQTDIIYHLFDNFIQYRETILEKRKNEFKRLAVFPCKLRVLPEYVFSVRDPIALGVRVEAGILKIGTPLCIPSKNALFLGNVVSIENEHQPVQSAKVNDEVCIKIETVGDESHKTYGKNFDHEDILVSRISRQTIDVCKEFHRKDLSKSEWQLMVELKRMLNIV